MRLIFRSQLIVLLFLVSVCSCQKIKDPPKSDEPVSANFRNISIDGTVNINLKPGTTNEISDVSSTSVVLTIAKNTLFVSGYGTLNLRIDQCDTVFVNANTIFNSSVSDFKHIVFLCNRGSIAASSVVASDSIDIVSRNLFINSFSGSTKKLNLAVNSTALFSGYGLITKNCNVTVNNTGDAEVYATESLKATINGNGDIYYKGNPPTVIPVKISGTGQIIPR